MLFYWKCSCDEGDGWMLLKNTDHVPDDLSLLCPFGDPAVVVKPCQLLQTVLVTVLPAEQVTDEISGQSAYRDRYYVQLTDVDLDETYIHPVALTKAETGELVVGLLGVGYREAVKMLAPHLPDPPGAA
jgi:hypothetical protein